MGVKKKERKKREKINGGGERQSREQQVHRYAEIVVPLPPSCTTEVCNLFNSFSGRKFDDKNGLIYTVSSHSKSVQKKKNMIMHYC